MVCTQPLMEMGFCINQCAKQPWRGLLGAAIGRSAER
jgi:hypothetical protein